LTNDDHETVNKKTDYRQFALNYSRSESNPGPDKSVNHRRTRATGLKWGDFSRNSS